MDHERETFHLTLDIAGRFIELSRRDDLFLGFLAIELPLGLLDYFLGLAPDLIWAVEDNQRFSRKMVQQVGRQLGKEGREPLQAMKGGIITH